MQQRRATIALTLVMLFPFLAASSCSSPSSTPSGVPCTKYFSLCTYYIDGGAPKPCVIDATSSFCVDVTDYYAYNTDTQKTYLCHSKLCTLDEANEVEPPINCTADVSYDELANKGQAWKVVSKEQNENTTDGPVAVTFTSTTSNTVTVSASVDIKVNADAIFPAVFVAVQAKINASVTNTATTVVGNSISMTIPAGKTGHGAYGVKMQITDGRLSSSNVCSGGRQDHGRVTTYVPIAPGWCVWLSDQPPCAMIT